MHSLKSKSFLVLVGITLTVLLTFTNCGGEFESLQGQLEATGETAVDPIENALIKAQSSDGTAPASSPESDADSAPAESFNEGDQHAFEIGGETIDATFRTSDHAITFKSIYDTLATNINLQKPADHPCHSAGTAQDNRPHNEQYYCGEFEFAETNYGIPPSAVNKFFNVNLISKQALTECQLVTHREEHGYISGYSIADTYIAHPLFKKKGLSCRSLLIMVNKATSLKGTNYPPTLMPNTKYISSLAAPFVAEWQTYKRVLTETFEYDDQGGKVRSANLNVKAVRKQSSATSQLSLLAESSQKLAVSADFTKNLNFRQAARDGDLVTDICFLVPGLVIKADPVPIRYEYNLPLNLGGTADLTLYPGGLTYSHGQICATVTSNIDSLLNPESLVLSDIINVHTAKIFDANYKGFKISLDDADFFGGSFGPVIGGLFNAIFPRLEEQLGMQFIRDEYGDTIDSARDNFTKSIQSGRWFEDFVLGELNDYIEVNSNNFHNTVKENIIGEQSPEVIQSTNNLLCSELLNLIKNKDAQNLFVTNDIDINKIANDCEIIESNLLTNFKDQKNPLCSAGYVNLSDYRQAAKAGNLPWWAADEGGCNIEISTGTFVPNRFNSLVQCLETATGNSLFEEEDFLNILVSNLDSCNDEASNYRL